jgi:hypothetical protein
VEELEEEEEEEEEEPIEEKKKKKDANIKLYIYSSVVYIQEEYVKLFGKPPS